MKKNNEVIKCEDEDNFLQLLELIKKLVDLIDLINDNPEIYNCLRKQLNELFLKIDRGLE